MSALPKPIERPLTEQIRDVALSGEVTLPPLPSTTRRLLELLQDEPGADARSVAATIKTDPALVAALLKAANAAFFSGLPSVTDLNTAVSRLGLRRVGSLVLTLQQKAQYDALGASRAKFLDGLWVHALATALAARALARQAGGDPEEAYLAGLLHDIGQLLVLQSIDHLAAETEGFEVSDSMRNEVLEATHAELGAHVLGSWGLPESICDAVRHHHADPEGTGNELALRLQAGDAIARKIGAHPTPTFDAALEELYVIERLGMTEIELAALLVDLEDELAQLRSLA
jgi:putative nucleotidyltransferase with HDIG domain